MSKRTACFECVIQHPLTDAERARPQHCVEDINVMFCRAFINQSSRWHFGGVVNAMPCYP
ncbi:hypothetical protein M3J09_012773 [Ascochyta lentis]